MAVMQYFRDGRPSLRKRPIQSCETDDKIRSVASKIAREVTVFWTQMRAIHERQLSAAECGSPRNQRRLIEELDSDDETATRFEPEAAKRSHAEETREGSTQRKGDAATPRSDAGEDEESGEADFMAEDGAESDDEETVEEAERQL